MSEAASTYTRLTSRPCGPVWWVTRRLPSIPAAAAPASAGECTSLTPPALPRPPAWICALTAHSLPPSRVATDSASAAVYATPPGCTGTPYLASSSLAWYSWMFMGLLGLQLLCHVDQFAHRGAGFVEGGFLARIEGNLDDLLDPGEKAAFDKSCAA